MRSKVPLITVLAMTALLRASADAAPPATQPDTDIPEAKIKQLLKLSKHYNQYRWSDPVEEDLLAEEAAKAWNPLPGSKMKHGKNGLIISGANKNSYYTAWRGLPKDVQDAEGLRIDAWLVATDVQRIPRLGLVLDSGPVQLLRGDIIYYFAYMQNGKYQRLQVSNNGGLSSSQKDLPSNKQFHVTLIVAGGEVEAMRSDNDAIKQASPSGFKFGKNASIGFCGREGDLIIRKISYRRLERSADEKALANLWTNAPFDSQKALTAFLHKHVVSQLGSGSFAQRHEATELLSRLMPLSQPAVRAALKAPLNAEMELRLEAIDQMPMALDVEKLDEKALKPPPEPEPEPEKKPKPEKTPRPQKAPKPQAADENGVQPRGAAPTTQPDRRVRPALLPAGAAAGTQ